MTMQKVLFICIHNSPKPDGGGVAQPHAATSSRPRAPPEPGTLNPLSSKLMREVVPTFQKKNAGRLTFSAPMLFTYVITVCDETRAEKCPIFPGPAIRMHWSFPIPPHHRIATRSSKGEKIGDEIRQKVEECSKKLPADANETPPDFQRGSFN